MNCPAPHPRRHCGLRQDRRGAVALEFALVALAFLPLCFGLIELGLGLWTRNSLQSAAEMTARCVAIASPNCRNPTQYAISLATGWISGAALAASGVVVQTGTTCSSAPGTMVKVSLSSQMISNTGLPPPLNAVIITAAACYPTSP
jgi:Flp pilus assembly protein TadG